MEPVKLSASAAAGLLAGIVATTIYLDEGSGTRFEVVPEAPAAAVEIVDGIAKEAAIAALTRAGTSGARCDFGVVANKPDYWYCTDGGTAGFLLDDATSSGLGLASGNTITHIDGKLYVVP